MLRADITLDPDDVVGPVPRRLFGALVEHVGRGVHTGLIEPGHPTADAAGHRGDVLDLVRALGVTQVRYPGGNFVSAHRWEDGVGPVAARPTRLDPAWHSVEDNTFGLGEMVAWTRAAGVELMYAVNLGTRGLQAAADVLEYANHPGGTALSDLRRSHGAQAPYDIRLWCLGNEMDGPWQVGHKTADEYGRLAAETARLMRLIDPRVELVVAGSSHDEMPTFGTWERTVLRHTAGLVDHVSVHAYVQQHGDDLAGFLTSGDRFERYVTTVAAIVDEVAAETGTTPVGIAVDEWNVWDQEHWNLTEQPALVAGGWATRPRLLEQVYTATDAVVVGSWLGVLLRTCDRVSMADLAQLVNVIAPIMTEPGGPAWRQPTYHPFALVAGLARGTALRPRVSAAALPAGPAAVDAAATLGRAHLAAFVTNRSVDAPVEVTLRLSGVRPGAEPARARLVGVPPDGAPRPVPVETIATAGGSPTLRLTLPPATWAALTLPTDLEP